MFVEIKIEQNIRWYGNNSTDKVMHVSTYKTKNHKTLQDTMHFPIKLFCTNPTGIKWVEKKEWKWTEISKFSGNCGSYSKVISYHSKKSLKKIVAFFEQNGFEVIVLPEDKTRISKEEMKFNNYLFGQR